MSQTEWEPLSVREARRTLADWERKGREQMSEQQARIDAAHDAIADLRERITGKNPAFRTGASFAIDHIERALRGETT